MTFALLFILSASPDFCEDQMQFAGFYLHLACLQFLLSFGFRHSFVIRHSSFVI